MYLRSSRVPAPRTRVPLVRLAYITNSQKLGWNRAQANCQGNFLISPPRPRRQKKGYKLRESGRVSTHLPSSGCQISHTTPKFLHGYNITPSQNENYTSDRWDFHTIPKLIAKLVGLTTASPRVNTIHLIYNSLNLHIRKDRYLGREPHTFWYLASRANTTRLSPFT